MYFLHLHFLFLTSCLPRTTLEPFDSHHERKLCEQILSNVSIFMKRRKKMACNRIGATQVSARKKEKINSTH